MPVIIQILSPAFVQCRIDFTIPEKGMLYIFYSLLLNQLTLTEQLVVYGATNDRDFVCNLKLTHRSSSLTCHGLHRFCTLPQVSGFLLACRCLLRTTLVSTETLTVAMDLIIKECSHLDSFVSDIYHPGGTSPATSPALHI